jgi:putative hydrolase of the HAD superfamily
VFDLDNTLYPHHVNLWQQVDERIGDFVSAWLKVSRDEARRIQKDYYRRYGTTMRGMMTEHGRARRRLSRLCAPDRSFAAAAQSGDGRRDRRLPGRKLILTNGSTDHADKVLARLGIGGAFRGGVRHHRRRARTEARAADLSEIPRRATGRSREIPRCSRIWRAISWCRTSSA